MAASSSSSDISDFTVDGIRKAQIAEEKARYDEDKKRGEKAGSSKTFVATMLKAQAEKDKEVRKEDQKVRAEIEAVIQKQLHTKINRYMTTFPFLTERIPKIGVKASIPELEEVLRLVREEMDSQRSFIQVKKYMDFGFMALTNYWGDGTKLPAVIPPALRFNLTGLVEYNKQGLFRNELEPLLMEIDIEYPWIGRQSLPIRLLETLSEVMMKTHFINTNPDAQKLFGLVKTAPKEVKDMDKL
jgi:hypothetical protein